MTKSTMPFELWRNELEQMALRKGASARGIEANRGRFLIWYSAGESLETAVPTLVAFAEGFEKRRRSDSDLRVIRAAGRLL